MIPFDKKAIEICKEYKFAFFNHSNRVVYGEYINNSYLTKSLPGMTIENKEEMDLKLEKGKYSCGEIGLPMTDSNMVLPCGIFARWEA